MSTLRLPEMDIQVESNGTDWQIYRVVDDEAGEPKLFTLLDCGMARTRWGMKFAVIRRLIPLIFQAEYQRYDSEAAKKAKIDNG